MKKLLKKIALASLLCLSPLSLIACHEDAEDAPVTPDPPVVETTYSILFDSLGGSSCATVEGKEGSTINYPSNPVKEYFSFSGWYLDKDFKTPFTATTIGSFNLTVYAKWTPVLASIISFESNGGTLVESIHGSTGDTISLPQNPTKDGYTFGGWFSNETLTTAFNSTSFDETNKTLYAKWTPIDGKYSINYHVANKVYEKFQEDGKITFDSSILPTGTKLDGWYFDEACTQAATEGTTLTKNVDLYASFYTEGLEFNGTKIVAYTGGEKVVYIPTVIKGVEINEISNAAFYNNKNITEVYLSDSIVKIDDYAFYRCEYLTNINISSENTFVGDYAFFNCKRLRSIETLGKTKSVGANAFTGCELLADFTMSEFLESIGDYAFADCSSLTSLVFGDSLLKIGSYALSDCTNLTSLSLGKNVNSIGDCAFASSDSLTSFVVSSENTSLSYENKSLMNASKTVLIKYFGDEESYVAPSTLQTIKAYAFSGNSTIKKMNIAAVATVEMGALANVNSLEELTLKDLSNSFIAYYFGASKAVDNGTKNGYVSKSLKKVVFTNDVLNVSPYAFYGINTLEEITGLTNTVTIDEYAFAYTNIKSYNLPATVTEMNATAFYSSSLEKFTAANENRVYKVINDCLYSNNGAVLSVVPSNIKELTISTGATTLVANTFNGVNLQELVIPANVTIINRGALFGINNLKTLTIPFIGDGKDNQYMHYLFGSNMTIEDVQEDDGTTSKDYSFDTLDCIPLTLATIIINNSSITSIPAFSFAYFEGLKNVVLPKNITTIGNYAFARCGFESLDISADVTSIGEFAYAYNFDLASITVASTNIGKGAFGYCLTLKTASFKEGIKELPEYCFMPYSETSSSTGKRVYYSSLTTVELPSSLTTIGTAAFLYAGYYGTSTVNNFEIKFANIESSKLEVIGDAAFEQSSISTIVLPASVKTVAQEAFAYCSLLKSVKFGNLTQGSKLETIGQISFVYATSLESIYIYKNVTAEADLPLIEGSVQNSSTFYPFYGASTSFKLYVPSASVELYKNSTLYKSADLVSKVFAL